MSGATVLGLPCPVSGCDRERRTCGELLCPRCWYRVPIGLRHRVWAKYRLYQDDRLPLAELRAAQSDAIASVQL
jgi:uncharacterized Zn finger protein (UPF0148 family)